MPFPSLGDLPDPVIKPTSPVLQVDSLPLSHQGSPFPVYNFLLIFHNPQLPKAFKDCIFLSILQDVGCVFKALHGTILVFFTKSNFGPWFSQLAWLCFVSDAVMKGRHPRVCFWFQLLLLLSLHQPGPRVPAATAAAAVKLLCR